MIPYFLMYPSINIFRDIAVWNFQKNRKKHLKTPEVTEKAPAANQDEDFGHGFYRVFDFYFSILKAIFNTYD